MQRRQDTEQGRGFLPLSPLPPLPTGHQTARPAGGLGGVAGCWALVKEMKESDMIVTGRCPTETGIIGETSEDMILA